MTLSPLVQRVKELDEKASPGPWTDNGYSRIDCPAMYPAEEAHVGPINRENGRGYTKEAYAVLSTVAEVPAEYGDTATGRHAFDMSLIVEYRTAAPILAAALAASQRETQEARQIARAVSARLNKVGVGYPGYTEHEEIIASWHRETDTGETA